MILNIFEITAAMKWTLHIHRLTFGCWLHGDLVSEVPPACSGNSCSPDQVLLPMVQVSYSVEQQLWIGFIFTGQLVRTMMVGESNFYRKITFRFVSLNFQH